MPARMLLVDDSAEDRILTLRELRREIRDLEAREVAGPEEFALALNQGPYDVVVTDYDLHWATGLKVLSEIRTRWPECPVIMFTGSGTEEMAAAATRAGLFDYVVKSARHRVRLPAAVRAALTLARQRHELRAVRDLYRIQFEQSQAGVYISEGGVIRDCNAALARIFGYDTPEGMRGLETTALLAEPPERLEELRRLVLSGVDLQQVEVNGRRKDGSLISVLLAASAHQDAGRSLIIGTVLDITAQARLSEVLQKASFEWRATFDGISSPLMAVRRDGTIVRLNRAAAALAGDDVRRVVGRRLADLPAMEAWWTAASLAAAVADDGPLRATVRDEASGHTWEITAFPAGRADDPDPLISLFFRDITDVVTLQETLIRSQTMSALGQLVAGVAHEVRSPLFGISATLDAFEARFGEQDQFKGYLDNLRRELNRLNELMRDLLDLGRPATQARTPERLGTVIDDAIQASAVLAAQRQVTVASRLSPADADAMVLADRRRLGQVFENLVKNAIQHAPPGSEVTVTARRPESDADEIELAVQDRGPGFRDEDLPRVFEPFFTRRTGGTGLGLAIVHRIVEDHGGRVNAGNRAEGGADLRVALPLHDRPASAA